MKVKEREGASSESSRQADLGRSPGWSCGNVQSCDSLKSLGGELELGVGGASCGQDL